MYDRAPLNEGTAMRMQQFIHRNNPNWNIKQDANRDQIVVQFNRFDLQRGGRLYITQHPCGNNNYDGHNTYEITGQLLREIQNISEEEDFLIRAGYNYRSIINEYQNEFFCYPRFWKRYRREADCDTHEGLKLAVLPDDDAKTRITWSGTPQTILKKKLPEALCQHGQQQGT